jgi:hypothetical protein
MILFRLLLIRNQKEEGGDEAERGRRGGLYHGGTGVYQGWVPYFQQLVGTHPLTYYLSYVILEHQGKLRLSVVNMYGCHLN